MGRLKKDHSGYHTHGRWLKYKLPSVVEPPKRSKAKKDTTKWCRGKIGVQHVIRRYFYYIYVNNGRTRTNLIRSKCVECGKGFYSKDSSIPLDIEVDGERGQKYPVQVKVNGKALPIDYKSYGIPHREYCDYCHEWHLNE